ncbi:GNAT family N-acetyltransferase [Desulfovibrio intestinalis]|uniref:Phosphinothricin acetyltransferase n=1 Tax=Desulfovibrio intestinalis TaxID=58621 RepID=A0A7W8BY60_9BACT|nr:GNAT family N-acetyltransferase [Desulfovibrio intestinalis]MBB5142102.1 phosphinothricin acetyltransferase [Desulfovibrio intestinalis]
MTVIRFATPADSRKLLKIYAQYMTTPITFECVLPSEQEFSERITHISGSYPYLVCEEDGQITGYAYAHRHMEREAYQWNAELSVYLDMDATSKGLGKRLYGVLMSILALQEIRNVYGCVTLPNARSEALHKSLGFRTVGVYSNAGYKNGKWHDVGWFEKSIATYDSPPNPFVSINNLPKESLLKIMTNAL